MNRFGLLKIILLSTVLSLTLIVVDIFTDNRNFLSLDIESSSKGNLQVFFDVGNSYNEIDSIIIPILKNGTYKIPIPREGIKALRIDPLDKDGIIKFRSIVINDKKNNELEKIDINNLKPLKDIESIYEENGEIVVNIKNGAHDPILELISYDLKKINTLDLFIENIRIFCKILLKIFISIILIKIFTIYYKKVGFSINYFKYKPYPTIFIGTLIFTLISIYPVLFFGKSFISLAGLALYSGPPFIPNYSINIPMEIFRGSDIGASAWAIAPSSFIESTSVFQYLELPFFNRFVGGGIPLFGQGQSMIGDPLHWVTLIFNGNSIGWDLKYIASRYFFSCGFALLAYILTGNLVSGILIGLTCNFIGFYAYRFNHPAYFVLTYCPWIILQWIYLAKSFIGGKSFYAIYIKSTFLIFIIWMGLNSGAPKEGVVVVSLSILFGYLIFISDIKNYIGYKMAIIIASGIIISAILMTSPYWMIFLDALSKSFTNYDVPGSSPYPFYAIIGFFESFVDQYVTGKLNAPSVNLMVLFFMTSNAFVLIANFKHKQMGRYFLEYIAWGLFLVSLVVAYGLVPVYLINLLPMINRIGHIGNTFSIPMIIFSIIISSYGIRDYILASKKYKKLILYIFIITCLIFGVLYNNLSKSWNSILLFYTFITLSSIIIYLSIELKNNINILFLLIFLIFITHFHHGMSININNKVDEYVINPDNRPDFSQKSDAIEFVKNRIIDKNSPSRVIGENTVFFPGYSQRTGLETIIPVDALRNKYFEELLNILKYPDVGWGWLRLIKYNEFSTLKPALDILGIGYVLAMPGTNIDGDLTKIYSGDLDVWENKSVWPRAFFVSQMKCINQPKEILDLYLSNQGQPFAALESKDCERAETLGAIAPAVKFSPAFGYKLTNNSTSFIVNAPEPGIVVLSESYYPGDFIAKINGKAIDYFRVNQAFKGVIIDKPGLNEITFTYRPKFLNFSLWTLLLGFIILWLVVYIRLNLKITK